MKKETIYLTGMYFCDGHDSNSSRDGGSVELSVFIGFRYSHGDIAAEHHFDWLIHIQRYIYTNSLTSPFVLHIRMGIKVCGFTLFLK
jgi:hypothetical protein